ncbi:MAG: DUF2975 domain-containing protein [Marvinbryantia sp.]|jgi:hypothetical protein
MKQKKLKKSAHFISILLNIGCILFGILSVLLFAAIMIIVCTKFFMPEMFQESWGTAIKNGQSLSFGQCVFFFTCCLGMFVCIFLALYNAKRIFGCIGKGNSPFTVKTGIQIRKIAVYVLLFAVFSVLSVFKISFPAFFMCALFALILFCISFIFDYGCELQQEVDETL